jgi:hypothetical protein
MTRDWNDPDRPSQLKLEATVEYLLARVEALEKRLDDSSRSPKSK